MKPFKSYIQEGISRQPVEKFGGRSMLDFLIDATGMVHHIDQHQKANPYGRHLSIDPESQHVFNSVLHPEIQNANFGAANYSLSGIIDHQEPNGTKIKIHVIHGDTGNQSGWGGLYVGGSIKHYMDGTNTLHVPFLVSRNNARPNTITHELAHALQDLSGSEHFQRADVRGRRGTDTIHSTAVGKTVVDSLGNLSKLPPQPPKGRRAKVNRQNEGSPWGSWGNFGSNYYHQGIELNARMLEKIPNIINAISQHHEKNGYADFVKQHSGKIETEAGKIKSEQARKRHKEHHYDKMFDLLASNVKGMGLEDAIAADMGDTQLKSVKNPKGAIAVRNEKLKEKQNKNLWLLASYIHERQINKLIHDHSGHNVLENRKSREQERSRPRPDPSVESEEKPQEKKSVFKRFKSFVGLK